MTVQEKITKMRELYIAKRGKEPTGLIIGTKAVMDLQRDNPARFLQAGSDYLGMAVIIDRDKTGRVEVGDFEV